jgi:DNA-binding winged helix-turn-helix (wHTH) protein/tetratricopeptide (TPR) repeat protein
MRRTTRFAGFDLDEPGRSLTRDGVEIDLQPRVFDLLAYLARHRDRVVSKEELLDAVWDGAFVADGAVQRAVSLARAALRSAGCEAIRTYPRQGYRFCAAVEEDAGGAETGDGDAAPAAAAGDDTAVETARARLEAGDWSAAARSFARADAASGGLRAHDLEGWGRCLEMAGDLAAAAAPMERAVSAYAAAGSAPDAARVALRLANLQLERREMAVAEGWKRRADRFLADRAETVEHGWAEWIAARLALFGGDNASALVHSERCLEIGRRQGDGDLEALGLVYGGLCHTALDDPGRGTSLIDEAGAAVLCGETGPWAGGLVFCSIIYTYVNRGQWRRAGEWTDQFDRWCESQGVAGFPGLCQLHRAEVMSLKGAYDDAAREVRGALELLAVSAPYAEGDAHRLNGEILLARGDLDAAEEAFRRAHLLGWDPNPGYARLQEARGRADAAVKSLEGSLAQTAWTNRQKRAGLLAEMVRLAARAGDLERARGALAELDAEPDLWATAGGAAQVAHGRGELALAEGDTTAAVAHLRAAVRGWREVPSACNMARVRVRLATALAADGDAHGADLELSAAEAQIESACLRALAAECRHLRASLGA